MFTLSTDVVVMALPVQNINHSAFRSMFEREKLSGNNFNDWFRQLKLVLRVEKKMYVIEQPLPAAPAANSEANVLLEWNAIYDAYNEWSERFDLIQNFHACKQEESKPVATYVIQMKVYVDQLKRLGYMLPQDLVVGLILNGLTKDFAGFVRNYYMHNTEKTIGEIHAMLIEYEKGLPKKAETSQVMMIKGGKIQMANKKSLKAKGKGGHQPKDDACHHCKEVGHCKRNSPVYLAKLLKKKKQVVSASSSGKIHREFFYNVPPLAQVGGSAIIVAGCPLTGSTFASELAAGAAGLVMYEIPEECRLPMTKEDLKAGQDLLKEDFMKNNATWVEELNLMEKMKQKVELQAFGTFHYNYLTKFYLPRKLKEIDD
ncbi:retrotransposon protein, putative, ty1-copia subclass [Tanacetum coccineum]